MNCDQVVTGYVYFILRDGGRPLVKIGWSMYPKERQRRLQTSTPDILVMVRTIPGGRDVERALHKRFAALRVNGEWFKFKGELAEFVGWTGYK